MHKASRIVAISIDLEFNFFSPLGLEAKSSFDHNRDHKTSKINSHSARSSKLYLNDNTPVYGREAASILRFSAENFESDLNLSVGN